MADYLHVEHFDLVVSLSYFLQQLVAEVVESGIVALQLPSEVSTLRASVPAKFLVGTLPEGVRGCATAQKGREESGKSVWLFMVGVIFIPVLGDIFTADPLKSLSDEVQDRFYLLVAAETHQAYRFLHLLLFCSKLK